MALAGALSPAVSAASAQAPASITDATTGLSDAASVRPVAACAPATAVRATCLAEVLGVRGSSSLVHPQLRRPSSPDRFRRPRARGSRASAAEVASAPAPQPGTPAYLQQAYDLAYLSQNGGIGTTVAVVDAFDDPNAEADLAAYRSKFSLPACTTANGCFAKLDQTGGTQNYPQSRDPGWELETSLDLDAISALCPNCHIVLVEANSDQITDLAAAQSVAAAQPGVTVISDSWDMPIANNNGGSNFASNGPFTFAGITTVAASGDAGYPGNHVNNYPAALPDVTAAGGTTLVPASTNGLASVRGFSESAWSNGGSGCDWSETKPAWEADNGCTGRSYSDISADGDPNTGMQVYDSDDNGWVVVGGTSESAPLIGAYYALLGASAQGPSWPYANAALLNDPSTGSDGSCAQLITYICNAGPGYDGPTGAGSISGAAATGAPGISGPGTNDSYTQSVTADTASLQGGVYPNGADTTYWWEYGTTTGYGQMTLASDIGSGTAPQSVSNMISGLQPGTTYHYRLVAQNSLGTEYGYDFTLTTAPSSTGSPTQTTPNPPASTQPTTKTPPTDTSGSGGGTSSSPTVPLVTQVRIAPTATSATIAATIATGGATDTYSIEYGSKSSLGRTITRSLAASSQTAANVSWNLTNLSPGRIYYFRTLVSNAAGSSQSVLIRFKTSPVTITRVGVRGNQLQVVLRCHGSAPCRVRLEGLSGSRVLLTGGAYIRGNQSKTVTLKLSKTFQTLASRRKNAKLLVLSTWNGATATVGATV